MKTMIKSLVIGPSGCGKTYHAGTYPKSYWICTEPAGGETLDINPELKKNVIKHDYYMPSPLENIKEVFIRIDKAIKEAHTLAKEGKIETLVLDNITYLSENRWIYINEHQKEISARSGNLDTQSMYGKLGRWLYQFVLINLCSFPGNVVVTSHIKLEHEEAMKKKVGTDDVVPDILGGFRNQAPGMFSLVMFLDKIRKDNGYKYMARVDLGSGKLAKNRYNLPEVIENVSYQTVLDAINKSKGEKK